MTLGTLAFVLLLPLQTEPAPASTSASAAAQQAGLSSAADETAGDDDQADNDPAGVDDQADDETAGAETAGKGEAGASPNTVDTSEGSDEAPAAVPAPPVPAQGRAYRGPVRRVPLEQQAPAKPDMTVEQSAAPAKPEAADDDTPFGKGGEEQPGLKPPKWWGLGVTLAASTKNLGPSFKLRYLWVMESQFGTDYLLTSALNGLSLDDLDAFRFTANTTVGFRLRPWPFSLDWRHAPAPLGPWPDLVFGLGGWSVMELDHVLQFFRQGDAGIFAGASVGGFLTLAFRDVTISLLFRPVGITAYWLHGQIDSTPFTLGNPILDVNLTWTLPL